MAGLLPVAVNVSTVPAAAATAPAWTVDTAAGTGVRGFSGDGGPAKGAQLAGPLDLAPDASGNRYVADTFNHRVRKVDPSGTITTVAGNGVADFRGDGGPATSASLSYPIGAAADRVGNLYIADRHRRFRRR